MARFERLEFHPEEWGRTLATFPDAIVYQSPAWLSFLAESQKGEPVVAALKDGEQILGYFTGLVVRYLGLKILGSPFRAWTCPYMGFALRPGVPRRVAYQALPALAFGTLGCVHFEIVDPFSKAEDLEGLGLPYQMNGTYEIDLSQSEETILAKMNSYRRRDIRRAEKNGVVIQEVEAHDAAFVDEFYEQLKDVFAKQGLVPTFGADRVRIMIKHLETTGMLLKLRARNRQGACIASGMFVGMHKNAFYWAGASWRQFQDLHPNEFLQWYSMRFWKRRGMKSYNLVGTMDFKARFGGQQTSVPLVRKSRNRLISGFRSAAPVALRTAIRLAWKLKRGGRKAATAETP